MTTDRGVSNSQESFSSEVFQALVRTLSKASNSPWLIETTPAGSITPAGSEAALVNCIMDGSLRGEFLLEVQREGAHALAKAFLGELASESEVSTDGALLTAISAWMKEFCSSTEQEYGVFTIQATTVSERQPEQITVCQSTAVSGVNRISISLSLNPVLVKSLHQHSPIDGKNGDSVQAKKVIEANKTPEPLNLNLVMDVELNVTLRFGQRKLTLREVLELTTGSVVELDRQVEEPVELLLDGTVIARGEAVVVDGNYGLRVIEVLQPVCPAILQ